MLASLWLVAKWLLLIAGLLGPGAALVRALRLPVTVATSFCGSAVALYGTVLGLQLTGLPIGLGSLAIGLAALAAAACLLRRAAVVPTPMADRPAPGKVAVGTTAVILIFGAIVLWRAWHEPLAGPDIEFRWAYLAEEMLRSGSLDFYPPRSAADFARYYWAESVPPGASALHAWAFACAGGSNFAWTVPAIVLQIWSLYELLWRCAASIGGRLAARFALIAAAACPLLTWSLLLGQEIGLTTLALIGMAWSYTCWSETRAAAWAAALTIFALLGTSAREYGLVFPTLAAAALWAGRADRRSLYAFGAIGLGCLVWPVRCWALTGNPVYSLTVDHLFPINARFVAWMQHDAASFGAPLHTFAGWREIARQFVLYAPAAVMGGGLLLVGVFKPRHPLAGPARLAAVAGLVVVLLWALSVPYTNGGLFYSLRVTGPALALGALAAGVGTARWAAARLRQAVVVNIGGILFVLATLPATLALPSNPWRTSLRDWPAFAPHAVPAVGRADDVVALVERVAPHGVIVADSPGFQRRFQPLGMTVIPLWSPQADWLFDRQATEADASRRWRESGVRTLIVTKWQRNLDFLNERSRWNRPPFQVHMVGETAQAAVFSITADR